MRGLDAQTLDPYNYEPTLNAQAARLMIEKLAQSLCDPYPSPVFMIPLGMSLSATQHMKCADDDEDITIEIDWNSMSRGEKTAFASQMQTATFGLYGGIIQLWDMIDWLDNNFGTLTLQVSYSWLNVNMVAKRNLMLPVAEFLTPENTSFPNPDGARIDWLVSIDSLAVGKDDWFGRADMAIIIDDFSWSGGPPGFMIDLPEFYQPSPGETFMTSLYLGNDVIVFSPTPPSDDKNSGRGSY